MNFWQIFGLLTCALFLSACGGGGSDAKTLSSMPEPGIGNYVPVVVAKGINGDYVNGLFTTVTLCSKINGQCASIENILVDTGSTGLRIMDGAIPKDRLQMAYKISDGKTLTECSQFVSGVIWGRVAEFDLKMGVESAQNLAVQIIGKSDDFPVPAECSAKGQRMDTMERLGANGILGISNFREDCGAYCIGQDNQYYYTCDGSGCMSIGIALADQIKNPVTAFAKNNNGTIIDLPDPSQLTAGQLNGYLIFGIDTESNNDSRGSNRIKLDALTASFTTIYNGYPYQASYFDSGSNGIFFDNYAFEQCAGQLLAGYYCPTARITLDVFLKGALGEVYPYSFTMDSARNLLQRSPISPVQPMLVGAASGFYQDFVWGLPFFYGKKFYTSIEANPDDGRGFYVAYK